MQDNVDYINRWISIEKNQKGNFNDLLHKSISSQKMILHVYSVKYSSTW